LYLSLIRRFCEQQAMVPAEIVDCLNRDDTSTAERLAHTLKGVSGNIGAGDVQAKAAAVESAIREEQPAAVVLELVADARQSLERAIAAIQALVPQEDDAEASELFTESQDLLAAGLGSASGPIRECLRNYDFEAALALLREAKARIPDLN
jgi:two-component system sensor histidine kinase/response regulator